MFAVVRTGGKQYRVAAGDKIVVEKIAGDAGDTIRLDDVLLAGEGADLRSTDGLIVSAEIIAQAKADKVIVFKKKRRHNYRRKAGHRQQHTILRITAIGDKKADKPAKAKEAKPAEEAAPAPAAAPAAEKPAKVAKPKAAKAEAAPAAEAAPTPEAPVKAGATRKAATKKPKADKEA
ncbi:MAG TPA: 50S ribosomal protein L21 [Allosphingosinicella sp.]|nr:50S ribosomal protein L21 [Allosphingosinicella sp.]